MRDVAIVIVFSISCTYIPLLLLVRVERAMILKWLRERAQFLPFANVQSSNRAKTGTDAGKWFRESPQLRDWKNGQIRTLFCHGSREFHSIFSLKAWLSRNCNGMLTNLQLAPERRFSR